MQGSDGKTVTQPRRHPQAVQAQLNGGAPDRVPSRGKPLVIMLWHAYFEALTL
ncbi:MAG: hypothetical protein ACPF9Y_00190 [Candidatus Puniceispirillaceae bacterium]|jgi:hypothetical protein|tara:strand:- start:5436 stop:5594 length:159 start_codon:yes stop_codon:yes gene_type:complete